MKHFNGLTKVRKNSSTWVTPIIKQKGWMPKIFFSTLDEFIENHTLLKNGWKDEEIKIPRFPERDKRFINFNNMKNKIKQFFYRIKYFIKHGKDDYGKRGFSTLMYKGMPVEFRKDVPSGEIWWLNDEGKVVKKEKL